MTEPVPVRQGADELRRLLEERTSDVRMLGMGGFREWLARRLGRWERDPVFAQRARIHDLRRSHPRLRALEDVERRARAADEASPEFARLSAIETELRGADQAIDGLTAAVERAEPDERARLQAKLDGFVARRRSLREEEAALTEGSEERQALIRASAGLDELREEIGLAREEARLRELMTAQGRRSGRSGAAFEDVALAVVEGHIVPEVLRDGGDADDARPVRILRGVKLGAARTEIDLLVIREAANPNEPVEVLAMIEAKRNLNDLGHGFRQRQENLAWLTGDEAGYDSAAYRTRHFASGHFDRPAVHEEGGRSHAFTRASFRRFQRDPATGAFLRGLYLVTRPADVVGLGAAALSRIAHRIATDERRDASDDAYLTRLLRWSQTLAEPIETPDVLRLYAATEPTARQILLIDS